MTCPHCSDTGVSSGASDLGGPGTMTDVPDTIWMFAANLRQYMPGGGKIMMGDTEYVRADVVDARVHATHRAGYDLARDDAAKAGWHLVTYDVMMKKPRS